MVEASVLFTPADLAGPNLQQQLPAASMQDVKRFENILLNGGNTSDSATAAQRDTPVLQWQELDTSRQPLDFKQSTLSKIAELDKSYQNMLSQFADMPEFKTYLAERLGTTQATEQNMRTYPSVQDNKTQDWASVWETAFKNNRDYMNIGLEYQMMMTRWSMSSSFWMSKFNLISAAVNQVSQGFKTLFRTGG